MADGDVRGAPECADFSDDQGADLSDQCADFRDRDTRHGIDRASRSLSVLSRERTNRAAAERNGTHSLCNGTCSLYARPCVQSKGQC